MFYNMCKNEVQENKMITCVSCGSLGGATLSMTPALPYCWALGWDRHHDHAQPHAAGACQQFLWTIQILTPSTGLLVPKTWIWLGASWTSLIVASAATVLHRRLSGTSLMKPGPGLGGDAPGGDTGHNWATLSVPIVQANINLLSMS